MSEHLIGASPNEAAAEGALKQTLKQPHQDNDPALAQTRAQLQATAKVHQQVLMEVGSLRQQNSALDTEVGRLRAAEAEARADLEKLEERKQQLERELELKKTKGTFTWFRKFMS